MLGISGADEQGRGLQEHHQPTTRLSDGTLAEDGGWSGQAGGEGTSGQGSGERHWCSFLDASRKGGMCDREGRVLVGPWSRSGCRAEAKKDRRERFGCLGVATRPLGSACSFNSPLKP